MTEGDAEVSSSESGGDASDVTYVRVGNRQHFVPVAEGPWPTESAYVALCGTVFIPRNFDPDNSVPRCLDCYELEVERLEQVAESYFKKMREMQDQADDLTTDIERWRKTQ